MSPNPHAFACTDYTQGKVFVVAPDGKIEWGYQTTSCNDLWVLPNGNTVITCGDLPGGARVFEVDKSGKTVGQVQGDDLPGISLKFVAGFHRLPNGNTVIANWLGHGQFGKSPHLIEITPAKRVVWTSANHETMRTVSSVQVLDVKGDAARGEIWR